MFPLLKVPTQVQHFGFALIKILFHFLNGETGTRKINYTIKTLTKIQIARQKSRLTWKNASSTNKRIFVQQKVQITRQFPKRVNHAHKSRLHW